LMQEQRHRGDAAHAPRRCPLANDRDHALNLEVDGIASAVAEELHAGTEPEDSTVAIVNLEHRAGLPGAVALAVQERDLAPKTPLRRTARPDALRFAPPAPEAFAVEV